MLKAKEYTTLEVLNEIEKDRDKEFECIGRNGDKCFARFRRYLNIGYYDFGVSDIVCFEDPSSRRVTPFVINSNIRDLIWTEVIETVKFEDWEVGEIYYDADLGVEYSSHYTLILGKPHYFSGDLISGSKWVLSGINEEDMHKVNWAKK